MTPAALICRCGEPIIRGRWTMHVCGVCGYITDLSERPAVGYDPAQSAAATEALDAATAVLRRHEGQRALSGQIALWQEQAEARGRLADSVGALIVLLGAGLAAAWWLA